MNKKSIIVENISKKYLIGNKVHSTLRHTVGDIFTKKNKGQEFWALKDVSFTVNEGESVAVIGKNGAGKSTLLNILSKITHPTKGRLEIYGQVSSLLEVGTGFHPELTGRENIFLNGSLLGMSRAEIIQKFDEIVDFSGVEKFIDTPVKRYSSGMYLRLAFSIAAHLNTEILIIDEVLAVGDVNFQKKCLEKIADYTTNGKTTLIVSHQMDIIRRLSSKAILLNNGELKSYGQVENVINDYMSILDSEKYVASGNYFTIIGNHEPLIQEHSFYLKEQINLQYKLRFKKEINQFSIMVGIETLFGNRIITLSSNDELSDFNVKVDDELSFGITLPIGLNLVPGVYNIVVGLLYPPYILIEKVTIPNNLVISRIDKSGAVYCGFLGDVTTNAKWEVNY